MKKIAWGSCWFNERVETVINFYKSSIISLTSLGYQVVPIIFDARFEHNQDDISLIESSIEHSILLKNQVDIFPNKNYGVALITQKAKLNNCDYIAVVDPDWDIEENFKFINNLLNKLIQENNDIVLPNIASASGRSNLLVGNPAISLFYPEYKQIIKTAFPGSVFARTENLYEIVTDANYHFDWGGEWDIISIAISKNMKISSLLVDVKNTRHRQNNSKIKDSFQIWKAVFASQDISKRLANIALFKLNITPYSNLSKKLLSGSFSATKQIEIISQEKCNETEKQLLYMILYPIAFLTGELKNIPQIQNFDTAPYNKQELLKMMNLAVFCVKSAIENCDFNLLHKNAQSNLKCEYLSEWQIEKNNYYLSIGE